ncbi:uncharacterized protein KY384_000635 [Bacidia gigantensis]|uniref:uncharacterized protein n=1 Tax=Bacidia gigantensis TaxID=2732470 RepID=UPI001D048766|nr:uncharacterized protein KY384_000635 [Bacidia gigantensis]KAG8525875.1 hypothetical protein KY384_000635 [Bacidia gigantensis]
MKRSHIAKAEPAVNLDYDARVPIPFSFFPSAYRDESEEEITHVKVEGETTQRERVGREDRYSSVSASLPGRKDRTRYDEEEVHIHEENRDRRPTRKEETVIYDKEEDRYRDNRHTEAEVSGHSHRDHDRRHTDTKIDIEVDRRDSELDHTESEFRRRTQPTYDVEYERRRPRGEEVVEEKDIVVDKERRHGMGYYDDDGRYHSFRHGLEKATDRVFHPFHPHHEREREEVIIEKEERERGPVRYRDGVRETVRYVERGGGPNTITIPCHHIRIGDLLILQGRPCQVIRITTSAQTGQYRYLGVDLFTKQLQEESSFVSNPTPSVIVQNMLGPVFKTYRVLDIRDDGRIVAMTETGDVKQSLAVIDQGVCGPDSTNPLRTAVAVLGPWSSMTVGVSLP